MFTDSLLTQIDEYIDDADNRYAIALVGAWGSGKTHFIDTVLRQHLDEDKNLIRLSLFGIRSANELYEKLATKYFCVDFFEGEQAERVRALEKQAAAQGATSLSSSILSRLGVNISLGPQAITALLNSNTVIVFDDCERTGGGTVTIELLGAINDLVEGIGCKVILIADDVSHIDLNLREKVIWKTLRYSPDPEALFDAVLEGHLRCFSKDEATLISACRTGASEANCNNARAMIRSKKLLEMILSSPILTDEQFTADEKARVVADCARQTFLKCMGKDSAAPGGKYDSILQPLAFENYCQPNLIDRFFEDQQSISGEEINALLTNYFNFCYPSSPSDRRLKELVDRRSELIRLDDTEVNEYSSNLSEHLRTQIVNDPKLLWSALSINLTLFDLGFEQSLAIEEAQAAAEKNIDFKPDDFLTVLNDELVMQEHFSQDCEQTELLHGLVDYCKAKRKDMFLAGIREKLNNVDDSAKGSVLFQSLTGSDRDKAVAIIDFSPSDVAGFFEKGNAQSQANLIDLTKWLKEMKSLTPEVDSWLCNLLNALDKSEVFSRMGRQRLSIIKAAIREIVY